MAKKIKHSTGQTLIHPVYATVVRAVVHLNGWLFKGICVTSQVRIRKLSYRLTVSYIVNHWFKNNMSILKFALNEIITILKYIINKRVELQNSVKRSAPCEPVLDTEIKWRS